MRVFEGPQLIIQVFETNQKMVEATVIEPLYRKPKSPKSKKSDPQTVVPRRTRRRLRVRGMAVRVPLPIMPTGDLELVFQAPAPQRPAASETSRASNAFSMAEARPVDVGRRPDLACSEVLVA
jgi:hypothetical protein